MLDPHPENQKWWGNIPYTPRVQKSAGSGRQKKRRRSIIPTWERNTSCWDCLREGEGVAGPCLKELGSGYRANSKRNLKELDPNFTPPESEAESPQEGNKKEVKTPALRGFRAGSDGTGKRKQNSIRSSAGKTRFERVVQILCPPDEKQSGASRRGREVGKTRDR